MNAKRSLQTTRKTRLGPVLGALALTTSACSEPHHAPSSAEPGLIALELQAAPSLGIDLVNYEITGNGLLKQGTIDVSKTGSLSARLSGLPAGLGYLLRLHAAAGTRPDLECAGQARFDVAAGEVTPVAVGLQCRPPARTGTALVNGKVNVCPRIDGLDVAPLKVLLGGTFAVSGTASDLDEQPQALTYEWESTVGAIDDARGASTKIHCDQTGPGLVTLTVSDGDCADSVTATVTCVAPPPVEVVRVTEDREDEHLEVVTLPPLTALPTSPIDSMAPLPPAPFSPGGYAGVNGSLEEVDVAHLGGAPNLPTPALIVSVVGTGAAGKLSSWTTGAPGAAPVHVADGPTLPGFHHRLRVLSPDVAPKLAHQMLVSARIHEGALWLSTWQVDPDDGSFSLLQTVGYAPAGEVTVQRFAIAHRQLAFSSQNKRFQLGTVVLGDDNRLRLATWEVNAITGAITGKLASSPSTSNLDPDTDLSLVFAKGAEGTMPHYTASVRNDDGVLVNVNWSVSDAGQPAFRGSNVSGVNLRNSNTFTRAADRLATAPLAGNGFVSATVTGGDPRVTVWENLAATCNGPVCPYVPSAVTSDLLDPTPNALGVQLAPPAINTNRVVLRDPKWERDLFLQNPDTVQAIASVRKVMVTIVALDAVAAGEVSLDDQVVVSAAAANVNGTGASVMGLEAGERISLRNLLYGNMMVSAGDATWAISEHVANTLDNMVVRMNNKANQLGMTSTFHCQSGNVFSSVAYSTARDQARLWESVYTDPLFLDFAGRGSAVVCGTRADNSNICHPVTPPMTKNMTWYPNLQGWKTGGGGGLCPQFPQYDAVPTCVSGGCLGVQASRLGRPLIAAELQPSNLTGTRFTDAGLLFDFAYQQIFTPDLRGDSGNQGGAMTDFALDAVNDLHAVVATVSGGSSLSLCNWVPDVSGGNVDEGGCSTHAVAGLSSSTRVLIPRNLQMVRVSTLEADGDYVLGRNVGGNLNLQLWRLGRR